MGEQHTHKVRLEEGLREEAEHICGFFCVHLRPLFVTLNEVKGTISSMAPLRCAQGDTLTLNIPTP